MPGKPSFLKDPDQGAELAALLQDIAEEREVAGDGGVPMTRVERARHEQTIARYRRWAAELVTEPEVEAPAPLQIRPATRAAEEATG
jgi:hypothetical protein